MPDQNPQNDDSTVKRWEKLIYNLLYPGILGSIVFDIADPLRIYKETCQWDARLASFAVFVAFSIDWWHMTNNLQGITKHFFYIGLDFFMMLSFGWSYYANSQITSTGFDPLKVPKNCRNSMLMMMLAFCGVLFFERMSRKKLSWLEFCLVLPIVACLAGYLQGTLVPDEAMQANLFALWFSAFFYFLYILGYKAFGSPQSAPVLSLPPPERS